MSTAVAQQQTSALLEQVVIQGDLSKLQPRERVEYYRRVCESVGLNPLTKPFEYITLNGKLRLYALRDATDQLRKINGVSIQIAAREIVEGCYIVTARATDKTSRQDEAIGAVPIDSLKGEARSNAMMKAETKAKRRVTLSICGMGWLDESEVDSIPSARPATFSDEAEVVTDETLKATSEQIAAMRTALKESGVEIASLLGKAEIEDISEMPSADVTKAIAWIKKQKKAAI